MKTIINLIRKFNRKNPHHTAVLDSFESYKGCYRICISDNEFDLSSWYIFKSCKDFSEWMDNVIL